MIANIILALIILLILVEIYLCFGKTELADKLLKPKYRIMNGRVEYLCRKLNRWMPVTYWDNKESKRTMTVYDAEHGRKHIIEYVGPGRSYVSSIDGLTFKNSKEIYDNESKLIDKENDLIVSLGKLKFVNY